ncbi:hypothetical protein APHCRT_0883 [Anaplasma phagocytophilum str. CRT53-1]|uniref:Uncharacterized protein n=1 Tax=Anaplasma phagocytophilum str. CRT53-1 TaxID=1359157 RepID=A0A0F3Q314_ANAPH|nr:hypothetical protein APHCRT_0883 [Anaplasma phagocytophilum str. CRT53-1]
MLNRNCIYYVIKSGMYFVYARELWHSYGLDMAWFVELPFVMKCCCSKL